LDPACTARLADSAVNRSAVLLRHPLYRYAANTGDQRDDLDEAEQIQCAPVPYTAGADGSPPASGPGCVVRGNPV
jgi:hypothetical protein